MSRFVNHLASSGGGSSPAAAGSRGLSSAVLHDGGGDGGPPGYDDDGDGDGLSGWGLGDRKDSKKQEGETRETLSFPSFF